MLEREREREINELCEINVSDRTNQWEKTRFKSFKVKRFHQYVVICKIMGKIRLEKTVISQNHHIIKN